MIIDPANVKGESLPNKSSLKLHMSQVEQIGLCKLIWTNIYLPQVATSNMLNMSGPSFPRILQLAWSRDMETIISQ